MKHYEIQFPFVGKFRFQMREKAFAMLIRGLMWGILRDFESPDKTDEYFVRGEALAWKINMFSSQWGIPTHRVKEFEASELIGDLKSPYLISFVGIQSRARK